MVKIIHEFLYADIPIYKVHWFKGDAVVELKDYLFYFLYFTRSYRKKRAIICAFNEIYLLMTHHIACGAIILVHCKTLAAIHFHNSCLEDLAKT